MVIFSNNPQISNYTANPPVPPFIPKVARPGWQQAGGLPWQISAQSPEKQPITPNLIPADRVTLSMRLRDTPQFKPDLLLKRFDGLTPQALRQLGDIRGVVFDVDDTLIPFSLHNRQCPEALKIQLRALQASGVRLGILTNHIYPRNIFKLQQELAASGIHMTVVQQAHKPEVHGYRLLQQHFNALPEQMVMVGDNPLTDIQGGINAGFKTIQVDWFGTSDKLKASIRLLERARMAAQQAKTVLQPNNIHRPMLSPPPLTFNA